MRGIIAGLMAVAVTVPLLSQGDAATPSWIALPVVNGGAEEGTGGWTGGALHSSSPDADDCQSQTPHSGQYHWCRDFGASDTTYQDISLAGIAGAIDEGRAYVTGSAWTFMWDGCEDEPMSIVWLNANGAQLGSSSSGSCPPRWIGHSLGGVVPKTTRFIRLRFSKYTDFDDVSARYCTMPPDPGRSAPASGSRTSLRPTFTWAGTPDATGYQIQVAYDSAFNQVALDRVLGVQTSYAPDFDLEPTTSYYWRVRGINGCGNGAWTSTGQFYTNPFIIRSFTVQDPVTKSTTLTNSALVNVVMANMSVSGATGYYLSQSSITPTGASAWESEPPIIYALTGPDGVKTIYAWARDALGTVSSPRSTTIRLDSTSPDVSTGAPSYSTSRIMALAVSAIDSSPITGWFVSQSSTPPSRTSRSWKPTKPTIYTLPPGDGRRSLYVFARDAAGNIGYGFTSVFVDSKPPQVRITAPAAGAKLNELRTVSGSTREPSPSSGLASAEFAILNTETCEWWHAQQRKLVSGDCSVPRWFGLPTSASWSKAIGRLKRPGRYEIFARATDRAGNEGQTSQVFEIVQPYIPAVFQPLGWFLDIRNDRPAVPTKNPAPYGSDKLVINMRYARMSGDKTYRYDWYFNGSKILAGRTQFWDLAPNGRAFTSIYSRNGKPLRAGVYSIRVYTDGRLTMESSIRISSPPRDGGPDASNDLAASAIVAESAATP